MAKNIDFMGAIFPDVPSIRLPQQGGGLVSFDDTTDANATASDIAQGKTAYVNGEKLVGTASGGSATIEALSVTANGTYTAPSGVDGYSPVTVNVSGGGGATNFVTGTFTTSSAEGVGSVSIPYTGTGYPISCIVVIEQGAYNQDISSWYNSLQRYAVGQWTMTKSQFTSAPTYDSSGKENQGVTTAIYKSSSSSATSYTRTSAMSTTVFSSSDATNVAATCIRIKPNKVLSYYVSTSSYGLLPSMTYRYIITYSS